MWSVCLVRACAYLNLQASCTSTPPICKFALHICAQGYLCTNPFAKRQLHHLGALPKSLGEQETSLHAPPQDPHPPSRYQQNQRPREPQWEPQWRFRGGSPSTNPFVNGENRSHDFLILKLQFPMHYNLSVPRRALAQITGTKKRTLVLATTTILTIS